MNVIFRIGHKMESAKRGFTLIELLVVVAILGVLASIILFSVAKARDKGIAAGQIAAIKQVEIAMGLYLSQYGDYPPVDTEALNGISDVDYLVNALSVENQFIPNVPSAYGSIFQYAHVCSDTTVCSEAGTGTNQGLINLMCGINTPAKALIVFRLKGGPSPLFKYDQDYNVICYN